MQHQTRLAHSRAYITRQGRSSWSLRHKTRTEPIGIESHKIRPMPTELATLKQSWKPSSQYQNQSRRLTEFAVRLHHKTRPKRNREVLENNVGPLSSPHHMTRLSPSSLYYKTKQEPNRACIIRQGRIQSENAPQDKRECMEFATQGKAEAHPSLLYKSQAGAHPNLPHRIGPEHIKIYSTRQGCSPLEPASQDKNGAYPNPHNYASPESTRACINR